MRRKQQDLQGFQIPTEAQPIASALAMGPGAARGPARVELMDLSSLSPTLSQLSQERREWNAMADERLGTQVAKLREEEPGLTDDQVIKRLTEKSPAQVSARLRKMVKAGSLDEADSPAFRMGLQVKTTEYRVRQKYREYMEEDNLRELAARYANADPGEQAGVLTQILRETQQFNQEEFGDLGFFGEQAAETMIAEQNEKLLQEVEKRGRFQMRQNYDATTFEAMGDIATEFLKEADAGPGGLLASPAEWALLGQKYGLQISRMYGDSISDPPGKAVQHLKGVAGQIARTHGDNAAAAFLTNLEESVVMPNGQRVLRDLEGPEIERAIDFHSRRAEDTVDARAETRRQHQREVQDIVLQSEAGNTLITGARKSLEALKQAEADLMKALDSGNLSVFGEAAEEDPRLIELALFELSTDMASKSGRFDAVRRAVGDRQMEDAYLNGGIDAVKDVARTNPDILPEDRRAKIEQFERLEARPGFEALDRMQSFRLQGTIESLAARSLSASGLGDDITIGAMEARKGELRSLAFAVMQEMTGDATTPSPALIDSMLTEFEKRARTAFPSAREIISPGDEPTSLRAGALKPGEGETEDDIVTEVAQDLQESRALFDGDNPITFGSLAKASLQPEDRKTFERLESAVRKTPRWGKDMREDVAARGERSIERDYGEVRQSKFLDLIKAVRDSKTLPEDSKPEVIGDVIARSGVFNSQSLTALAVGDATLAQSFMERDLKVAGVEDPERFLGELFSGPVGLGDFSPFKVRLVDFKDAKKMFTRNASAQIVTTEALNDVQRQRIINLLEASGQFDTTNTSQLNDWIGEFLFTQSLHHGR